MQAASAAWNLGNWEEMAKYVQCLDGGEDTHVHMPILNTSGSGNGASDGAFFRAVLCVWRGKVPSLSFSKFCMLELCEANWSSDCL